MYLQYFGLETDPFTISPDPAFLYPSPQHRQALAHLKYGLDREGGFILLTGEVGTGKTTLTRLLLEQLPGNVRVAYILNTKLNSEDVLASICQDLSLDHEPGASIKTLTDLIYKDLLETHSKGKKTLLVLEEAQNLDPDVLETLRLLTNLETNTTKLLHILLVGQPELQQLLARNELRQLNQRVVSRFHIEPLDLQETTNYLNHRLRHAGSKRQAFDAAAIKQLHKLSGGIPRMLNLLAERSLLGAYATNAHLVNSKIVQEAKREVLGDQVQTAVSIARPASATPFVVASLALVVLVAIGLYMLMGRDPVDEKQIVVQSPHVMQQTPQETPVQAAPVLETRVANAQSGQEAPSQEAINQAVAVQEVMALENQTQEVRARLDSATSLSEVSSLADGVLTTAQGRAGETSLVAEQQSLSPTQTQSQAQTVVSGEPQQQAKPPVIAPEKNTYGQLLALWGVDAQVFNQKNFCLAAQANSLKCRIDESLDLNDLTQINRPGLVTLPGDGDSISLFMLNAFDGNDIILSNSSHHFSMSKRDFVDLWDGGFVYIWRPPAEFVRTLYPGARDVPMTRWLQEQLGRVFVDYEYVINGGAYSQYMVRAVARFQSQQGLEADGLLGARTILRLMDQTEDLPRLDRYEPLFGVDAGVGNF